MEGGNRGIEKRMEETESEIEEGKEEIRDCIKVLEKKIEELEGAGGGKLEDVDLKERKRHRRR